jgi:hypothetical protein
MTPLQKRISEYEDAILEIIDNQDDITRSDLQGIVGALVRKIMNDDVNIQSILEQYQKWEKDYFNKK